MGAPGGSCGYSAGWLRLHSMPSSAHWCDSNGSDFSYFWRQYSRSHWHLHCGFRKVKGKSLSCVRLFSTLWAVAYQASSFMGFSRQECRSGLPFPSPGDLPDPGIKPRSPALQTDALPSEPPGLQEVWLNIFWINPRQTSDSCCLPVGSHFRSPVGDIIHHSCDHHDLPTSLHPT